MLTYIKDQLLSEQSVTNLNNQRLNLEHLEDEAKKPTL